MAMRDFDDTTHDACRGAQPVGDLSAASPAERRFVRAMRQWLCGGAQQEAAWRALSGELGAQPARDAMRALEAFLWAVAQGAQRRICRHNPDCPSLGRDEALLAAVVAAAARGGAGFDRAFGLLHEAVRADARPAVIATACSLGRALNPGASVGVGAALSPAPPGARTLH